MHEAHFAVAAKRAGVVEAVAVLAEIRVVGALVNVLASLAITAVAYVADALSNAEEHTVSMNIQQGSEANSNAVKLT